MRHAPRVVCACLLTTAAGFAGNSFAATAASSAAVLVGDQTVESTVSSVSSGSADAFAFTAASGGTASSISVYLDGQNRASALRVGLYSDAGGNPGTLLAAGSTSSPNAGAWNTVTIVQTTVSAQSTYWIAVLGSGGTLYFRAGSGGSCRTVTSGSRRLRSLPSSWRTQSSGGACPISAYASGTASGGGSGSGGGTTPAPTAAFSYSPSAPVTGQSVQFDASASSCAATPCTYSWSDLPLSGGVYPLGTGTTLAFTFQVAGTKYVTLTVTDAQGRTASVEHNVTVSTAPTQTQAPLSTAAPSISGTAQQGQTVKTSDGSWSNGVTGLSYAWQDCNSSGGACAAIAGATSASYTLTAADVGHTIRSVVTATNAGGSTSATSAATAVVTAVTTPPPPPPPSGNCDLNATPSTFASQVSAAAAGQTVCLATGSYGTWTGTNKAITVKAAAGATPTMKVNFGTSASGFTLDGMSGMGGVVAGSKNITIQNSVFTSSIDLSGPTASNVVLNHNDLTWPTSATSPNAKVVVNEGNGTQGTLSSPALIIENNDIENGDLDGIHIGGGAGVIIKNNRLANLCDIGTNHTDNIQFEGGSQIDIVGNYVYEAQNCPTQGITSYDGGTNGVIIETNVVDIPRDWGIEFYSDQNSVIRHNTVVYHPKSYSEFGTGTGDIDVDRKSQDPAGTGTHVYDNVASVSFANGSTGTADHNTSPSTVSYMGGAPGPTSVYSGLYLAAGSPGVGAASDGLDTGIEHSLP